MSTEPNYPAGPDEEVIVQPVVAESSHSSIPREAVNDIHLLEMLRDGNEAAFVILIDRYHASMLRLAQAYVPTKAVAEEVVQEAWLGVLQGLHRFEGRSSLKTWMFHILTNCAKTCALREGRSIAFSFMPDDEIQSLELAVDPERFIPPDDPQGKGRWATYPQGWDHIPETRLLSQETHVHIERAIEALPPGQRAVITLRDIEGWTSEEVCRLLEISQANQRVLLHRARSKVRRALAQYLGEE